MSTIKSNKAAVFEEELSAIKSATIRDSVRIILGELPDYFFRTAASSTGKYHPSYALGSGGLVRHTKAAVKICNDLLSLEYNTVKFEEWQRDIMIAALILHDGMKHGLEGSQYTVAEHPVVMADYIKGHKADYSFTDEELDLLTNCISTHMGQWNTDFKTKAQIMNKPSTEEQYFVHLCDYLASRKYLDVSFDNNYAPEMFYLDEARCIVDKIIQLCQYEIAEGGSRDELIKIIAEHNNGNGNPKSITALKTAESVYQALIDYIKEDANGE